jgi:hypothetical protein
VDVATAHLPSDAVSTPASVAGPDCALVGRWLPVPRGVMRRDPGEGGVSAARSGSAANAAAVTLALSRFMGRKFRWWEAARGKQGWRTGEEKSPKGS